MYALKAIYHWFLNPGSPLFCILLQQKLNLPHFRHGKPCNNRVHTSVLKLNWCVTVAMQSLNVISLSSSIPSKIEEPTQAEGETQQCSDIQNSKRFVLNYRINSAGTDMTETRVTMSFKIAASFSTLHCYCCLRIVVSVLCVWGEGGGFEQ